MKSDAERLMQEFDNVSAENKEYMEQISALEAEIDRLKAEIFKLQAKL
jgi:prefoldin subunit 5